MRKALFTSLFLLPLLLAAGTLRITDSSRGGSSALRQAALEYSVASGSDIRIDRMAAESAAALTEQNTVDLAVWEIGDIPEKFKKNPQLPLGCEALVIYVNSANPLPGITSEQAKDIFSGLRPRWSELGWRPRDIHRINLKNTSEHSGLDRDILGAAPAAEVLGVESSKYVVLLVGANPDAMGFAHMTAGDENVNITPVNGVMPSKDNICSGKYPLSRRYVLVTVKNSPEAENFIRLLKKDLKTRVRRDMWLPLEQSEK